MRLSDAIALGRTLANGITADIFIHSQSGCACAIGMAQLASGRDSHSEKWVFASWAWLNERKVWGCPSCDCQYYCDGIDAISHVMGHVKGTTEILTLVPAFGHCEENLSLDQLIDWVRSIEPPEIEQSEPQQVAALEMAEVPA